jgi:hypothetical protein
MTVGYLNMSQAVQLDANGNGMIVLKPDANDWWAPDFIKVATSSQLAPFPYAAVYHVSPGVALGPTSFIDDTYGANNDTSSIISGTIVQFGESIVAKFTGGTPGDTAVLTIFGMHSDLPIGMEVLPSSPGTHFSQRIVFAGDVPTLIDGQTNVVVGANGGDLYYPGGSILNLAKVYQVSRYNSFRCEVDCSSTGNKEYFAIELSWFSDAGGQNLINSDYFTFSSDGNSQFGTGIIRGPYLQIRFHNYDNVATNFLNFLLYGSQRIEPRTQFRTHQTITPSKGLGTDNIVFNGFFGSIAANGGVVTTADFNFWNGPVTLNAWVSTTPATVRSINIVLFPEPNGVLSDNNQYEFYLPLTNADFKSPFQTNIAFPRRVMRAQITNNDTAANNVHLNVTAQEL